MKIEEVVRRSHAVVISVLALTLLVAAAIPAGASAVPAAGVGSALTEKKRCKLVKKKVRGKTRKVRVCTAVRPKGPAKARNIGMTLDGGRAASQALPVTGGTVATAAATGAALSLDVPADALVVPTAITITPVRSAATPAGVRMLAAAQLGPEGLGLAKPATLAIVLPAGIPARNVHAFGWFGVGENVHRLPVRISGNRAEISLTHFSGAGIAVGEPDWPSTVTALTLQFGRSVRPQIRAAETNDALVESAFNHAFGWQKAVELLGLGDRFKTWREEIRASYAKAILNALDKATDRCVDGHDLTQVGRLFAHARTIQLFGIAVPGADPLDRAVRCARFELDGEIVIRMEQGDTYFEHHVLLRGVPITMGAGLVLSGTKAYEYVAIRTNLRAEGPCSMQGRAVAPFSVTRLDLPLAARPDGAPPPQLELELVLGEAEATLTCDGVTNPTSTYIPLFGHLHADERADTAFRIRNWEWIGGAVVARKRYDRTLPIEGGALWREQTTLTLRHTPLR